MFIRCLNEEKNGFPQKYCINLSQSTSQQAEENFLFGELAKVFFYRNFCRNPFMVVETLSMNLKIKNKY